MPKYNIAIIGCGPHESLHSDNYKYLSDKVALAAVTTDQVSKLSNSNDLQAIIIMRPLGYDEADYEALCQKVAKHNIHGLPIIKADATPAPVALQTAQATTNNEQVPFVTVHSQKAFDPRQMTLVSAINQAITQLQPPAVTASPVPSIAIAQDSRETWLATLRRYCFGSKPSLAAVTSLHEGKLQSISVVAVPVDEDKQPPAPSRISRVWAALCYPVSMIERAMSSRGTSFSTDKSLCISHLNSHEKSVHVSAVNCS